MRANDIQNAIQIWQNAGFKFVEIHGEELHVGNNKNKLESVGRIDDPAVSARYMVSILPFGITFHAWTLKHANERFVGAKLLTNGYDCIIRLHDRTKNAVIANEQNSIVTDSDK